MLSTSCRTASRKSPFQRDDTSAYFRNDPHLRDLRDGNALEMNPLRNLLRQLVVTRHLRKHSNSFHLRGISLSVPDTIPLGIRYQLCIGSYERTELKLVERHLPRHQPVVELGGCLGVVSAYVRSLLEPSVPLITLEANPNLIEICKANIERQRRGAKSEVVSGALSYNAGRASFHVSDNTHVSRLCR